MSLMSRRCSYCNHTKSFHHADGCKFVMTEDEFCDCFCFTEIKDYYEDDESED